MPPTLGGLGANMGVSTLDLFILNMFYARVIEIPDLILEVSAADSVSSSLASYGVK